jgi:hypothetical protein
MGALLVRTAGLHVLVGCGIAVVTVAAGAGAAKASALAAFHTPRWAAQCYVVAEESPPFLSCSTPNDGFFVTMGKTWSNLDHIVVGPGGVFLLDTKNLGGTISVKDGALAVHFQLSPIDDYVYTGLSRAMGGAARGLRDRLQKELGWIVDVYPVVVIHGVFPQRVVSVGRLTYVAVEELAEWLDEQPRRLAAQDQPAVARAVEQLPPARDIAERLAGDVSEQPI